MLWNHDGRNSDAFAVSHTPKKKSRVKCLSCGYSGDLTDLLFDIKAGLKKNLQYKIRYNLGMAAQMVTNEFGDLEIEGTDIPDYEDKKVIEEFPFPEEWLDTFKKATEFPEAMGYFHSRGILPGTVDELDVRFDTVQKRVCFPFRDFKGRLMGLQGRRIYANPNQRVYNQYGHGGHRNSHVWMGENTLNMDKPVVLCEGPFDYLKIYQVYQNVAASFTSGLARRKVLRMGDADTIITFYDFGAGGDSARKYLRKYLPKYHIIDIIPTQEEDDAGSMPPSLILEYLHPHLPLS